MAIDTLIAIRNEVIGYLAISNIPPKQAQAKAYDYLAGIGYYGNIAATLSAAIATIYIAS